MRLAPGGALCAAGVTDAGFAGVAAGKGVVAAGAELMNGSRYRIAERNANDETRLLFTSPAKWLMLASVEARASKKRRDWGALATASSRREGLRLLPVGSLAPSGSHRCRGLGVSLGFRGPGPSQTAAFGNVETLWPATGRPPGRCSARSSAKRTLFWVRLPPAALPGREPVVTGIWA